MLAPRAGARGDSPPADPICRPVTQPHINRIATAVPQYEVHSAFRRFADMQIADARTRTAFARLADKSHIDRRFSVLEPRAVEYGTTDGFYELERFPSTGARMARFEAEAPALAEAECMRRLLPPDEFTGWFARFLPRLAEGEPATLFRPAAVSDRGDGKIVHLDGLNLSRAWCWRSLAAALPESDGRRRRMEESAEAHLAAALPHVAGDYMGEHWLASFAVLALEA